jgi:hypothetical protein
METALIRLVWQRAKDCCEYCRLPQALSNLTFEVDHIIARVHGGPTIPANLALSCFYCNSYKGPNLSGIDPRTRAIVRLFHPRRHKWSRHFRWKGPGLVGRTAIGRATIAVLKINEDEAVSTRRMLMEAGLYPRD